MLCNVILQFIKSTLSLNFSLQSYKSLVTPVVVWSHWQTQVGHCVCMLSHVQLFAIPWTVAHQVPLSMGFSRQECWSGLPFSPPGESSWPRDRTWASCIGRRIFTDLNHQGNHVPGKTSHWDVISKLSWLYATTQKRREWIWTCFLPPKPTFFTLVCFFK